MTDTALLALANASQDLTEEEALILAEMQADDAAFDLQPARVKIAPGGIGKFLLGDEAAKEFVAVVAISQKIRGYWPDQGAGNPPLCSSPDGTWGFFDQEPSDAQFQAAAASKTPHPGVILLTNNNEPLPPRFSCARCPLNQWGSEHQRRGGAGRGKACKEMRRLLLLIDGWTLPALMSLPPTSIRAWDSYCSALAAKRSAYFAVRTRFSLDTARAAGGETYNVVQVEVAEKIQDLAQLKAIGEIRQRYRELVTGMPVDASEYEVRDADAAPADEEEIPF